MNLEVLSRLLHAPEGSLSDAQAAEYFKGLETFMAKTASHTTTQLERQRAGGLPAAEIGQARASTQAEVDRNITAINRYVELLGKLGVQLMVHTADDARYPASFIVFSEDVGCYSAVYYAESGPPTLAPLVNGCRLDIGHSVTVSR